MLREARQVPPAQPLKKLELPSIPGKPVKPTKPIKPIKHNNDDDADGLLLILLILLLFVFLSKPIFPFFFGRTHDLFFWPYLLPSTRLYSTCLLELLLDTLLDCVKGSLGRVE